MVYLITSLCLHRRFEEGQYGIFGNITHIAFADPASVSEAAKVVVRLMDINSYSQVEWLRSLRAYFPLTCNRAAKTEPLVDLVKGARGAYKMIVAGMELLDSIREKAGAVARSGELTVAVLARSDELGRTRAERVKQAMSFVWGSYRKYAWGFDELKPLSRQVRCLFTVY
jgi:hypothetical protein